MDDLNDVQRDRLKRSGFAIGDRVEGRWHRGVATITRFRPCGDRFVDAVLEQGGKQIGWCGIDSLRPARLLACRPFGLSDADWDILLGRSSRRLARSLRCRD